MWKEAREACGNAGKAKAALPFLHRCPPLPSALYPHPVLFPSCPAGDLKNSDVATSFGFDTACKVYSEMIGNIMIDALSAKKYYHFIR